MPFVQRVDGHEYILTAVVQDAMDRLYIVKGADVYTRAGVYMGFWPVENMPDWLPERLRWYFQSKTRNYDRPRIIKNEDDLWI